VYVVEPIGVESLITIKIGSQHLKMLVFDEDIMFTPGQKIRISFKKDKIRFFDRDRRLIE